MVTEVFWTKNAVTTYNRVLDYLEANWPVKVTDDFIKKTQKIIDLLSINNVRFRSSGRDNVYEALITKHNLLIYRVKTTHIELLRFYDTRQNPRKKKF